jgi:hypothetical protein
MTVKETAEYDNFLGKKEELAKPAALFEIEENEENEREKLWVGMPECEQKDNPPFKTIYLHFRNKEDFDAFVSKYKTRTKIHSSVGLKNDESDTSSLYHF